MINRKKPPPIYQAIPLSPDDSIYVEAMSSFQTGTILIQGTAFNDQGDIVNFSESLLINTVSVAFTKVVSLGYSFLLSCAITTTSPGILDADLYVRMSLINPRTTTPVFFRKILDQGYVSVRTGLSYGSPSVGKRSSDPWQSRIIVVPDPGATTEFSYQVPESVNMIVNSVSRVLTTSAAVANRQSHLVITDPNNFNFKFGMTVQITAGLSVNITHGGPIAVGLAALGIVTLGFSPQPVPPETVIRSETTGLQVGDEYTAIIINCSVQTIPHV